MLVLTEIYAAGEKPIAGRQRRGPVPGAASAAATSTCASSPARDASPTTLLELVRPGDLVLTLGAGDIYRSADELLALLRTGAPIPQIH